MPKHFKPSANAIKHSDAIYQGIEELLSILKWTF